MAKAPIADSMKLTASLVQLHPHFPSWQGKQRAPCLFLSDIFLVLSWKTIIDVHNQTYENEAVSGGTADSPALDENVMSLRVS